MMGRSVPNTIFPFTTIGYSPNSMDCDEATDAPKGEVLSRS